MSSYEEKHDQALLIAPWLSQDSGSSVWLFKYAHHPDRAGYVFLATDLCGIYFESLTAPSVPARLSEIASMTTYGTNSSSALRSDSQRDVRSVMTQAGDTLDRLDEIMRPGSGMEGLVLEVQDHDFHDKLFVIRSGDFTWSFNTTELKSRQPLTTIGKHLISPLSQLLLNSSHISPPRRSSPTDLAAAAINALGPMPTSSSAQAGPSKSSESRPPARPDVVKDSFEMPHETTQDDEEYGSDEDIVPSAAGGHASSSNLDVVNRAGPSEQEKRSVSPVKGSPAPNTTRPLGKRKGRSDESQGDFPTPTPNAPTQDTQNSPVKPRNKTADAGSASSPVKPAAPSQSSQKTKKEKEREEEEAWEKRREEMKRKMQTGTAGGTKLGRRRLAR